MPETFNTHDRTYSLDVNTSWAESTTRALTAGANGLTSQWDGSDRVQVQKDNNSVGQMAPVENGSSTVLHGELAGAYAVGDRLTLYYPDKSKQYSGQRGTLDDIAANFDYSMAEVEVLCVNEEQQYITTSEAVFENQQAITKFTFNKNICQLVITAEGLTGSPVSVTTDHQTNVVYVAMTNNSEEKVTYTFTATDGKKIYKGTKKARLQNAKYYEATVTLTEEDEVIGKPLTLKAKGNGTITIQNPLRLLIWTGKDDASWTFDNSEEIAVSMMADECLMIKGDYPSYGDGNTGVHTNIQTTMACEIYGNIMSLVNSTGFKSATTLTGQDAFYGLFSGNTKLINSSIYPLLLPATTITGRCYYEMFKGCTGLTVAPIMTANTFSNGNYACCSMFEGCSAMINAPALPATTLDVGCYKAMFKDCSALRNCPEMPAQSLASYCYQKMFENCTSLLETPMLPATTLVTENQGNIIYAPSWSCYESMFEGCTALVKTQQLPATKLADNCYSRMFMGCTALTTAPALPAEILAKGCYTQMFRGCTALKTAPALPAITLTNGCYNAMFYDCSKLTTAPDLMAEELTVNSYTNMFRNCAKLASVKCKAKKAVNGEDAIPLNLATYGWLTNVAEEGTFYKNPTIPEDEWERGQSGIPENWTVQNIFKFDDLHLKE